MDSLTLVKHRESCRPPGPVAGCWGGYGQVGAEWTALSLPSLLLGLETCTCCCWSPLLLAAQAARAAGRGFAATLWARGVHVTLGALWLWGCWGCGKKLRPFPESPTDTLGFSRRVALPTSEQAVRRLPVGCVASAGHTSTLISRSPSKYLTGDEVQVPWDSWARGRPLPLLRTSTLFRQCRTCHILTRSFSFTLAPRMQVSSVVYPRCPQTHDCTPRAEHLRPRLVCVAGPAQPAGGAARVSCFSFCSPGPQRRGAQLRHAAPCVCILTQSAHCWHCKTLQL